MTEISAVTPTTPEPPKTPEHKHTREQVVKAFNETFDDYRISRQPLTPQDEAIVAGIQAAKEKTIDKGKSRAQNKFSNEQTGEQFVTLEGVPIDRLLGYLKTRIESGLLTPEEMTTYKERWDILNSHKRPFLQGKQLNPSVRVARNQQEAALMSQTVADISGEAGFWNMAEVELSGRFELVLPPKPKVEKAPTDSVVPEEHSTTPPPRLVGGETTSVPLTATPRPRLVGGEDAADKDSESESELDDEHLPEPTVEGVRYELAIGTREPDLEKRARDEANAKLMEKLRGRNIFRRIKYRIAEEYYRQKFTQQALSAMREHHNTYLSLESVKSELRVVDPEAGRANQVESDKAKVEEIKTRLKAAELGAEGMATGIRTAEGPLRQQLIETIIRPVINGDLTDPQEVQRTLAAFVQAHADDPVVAELFGSDKNTWGQATEFFATDLLEVGRAIKADFEAHDQSMKWLDQLLENRLDIHLARPQWASATETQKLSRTDRFIKWAQSRRVTGAIFNPAVVGAASSLATFAILRAPLRVASTVANFTAPGAGALSGGLFAAVRRNYDAKVDISSHRVEREYGMQIPAGSKRREKMEEFAYDTVSVTDLINGGGVDRQRDGQPRRSVTELVTSDLTNEANQQDLVSRIAEIEARLDYSDVNKVGLITFQSGETIEQGRMELVKIIVEGRQALRNAGVDDSRISVMRAALAHDFETNQAEQDKRFKRYRLRSSLANGAFGSVAGLVSGVVVQEGVALGMRATGHGVGQTVLERAVGYEGGGQKTVDVFRDLAGRGGSYDVSSELRFNVDPANHTVQISDIATGKSLTEVPIKIGEDGSMVFDGKMPPELQDRLTEARFEVLDKSTPPQVTTRTVEVPGTPTTTTEIVGGPQAVEQWRQIGTHYDQQQWYRNDTPGVYDLNEHRAYTIKQGDTLILDMSRMHLGTESGLSPNPIDVQNVIQSKEAGFSFKIPGGGNHQAVWIPESADGVADGLLHLDPNDTTHMVTMGDGSQMSIAELSKMIVNQDELAQFNDGDIATEVYNRREVFRLGNNGRKGWWEVGRMTDQNGQKVLQTFATGRGVSDAVGVKTTEIPGLPTTQTITEIIPGKPEFEIIPPKFTELHDPIPLIPIPFAPRWPLEPLTRRVEFMYGYGLAGGGNIPVDRREEFARRRSKTLQTNPKAVLDAREEARRYLDAQPEPYRRVITELADQITVPPSENLKIAVCIPVAGHQEGGNIYTTLDNYRYQDLPTDQFELILFVNRPRVDNSGNAVAADNTISEIERFQRDHPDIPVRVISKVLEPEEANMGTIRKMATDAALTRTMKRTSTSDVIFVSNDADMKGVSPKYLSTFVSRFESNSSVDALLGQLDWDPEGYIEHPAVHIGTRLFQFLGAKGRMVTDRMPSSGANFAFKSSIYAAIGGYSENMLGEDIALGEAILLARSTNRDAEKWALDGIGRIKYGKGGTRLYTSARRAIDSLKKGMAPLQQWDSGFSVFDDEIRRMKLGEGGSIDYSNAEQVEKVRQSLSWVIDRTISVWDSAEGLGVGHQYYRRALGFLGVTYDVVGGKIVVKDFTKLIEGLKRYQAEGLALRDRKSGKGGPRPIRTPIESGDEVSEEAEVEAFDVVIERENNLAERVGSDGRVFVAEDKKNGVSYAAKEIDLESQKSTALEHNYPKGFTDAEEFIRSKLGSSEHVLIADRAVIADGKQYKLYTLGDGDLSSKLKDGTIETGVDNAVAITSQVLRGLQEIHNIGVFHTDLSTPNILLMADGSVKIIDFGNAAIVNPSTGKAKSPPISSNKWITAPELYEGTENVTAATDTYEAGIMLFKVLTGKYPYISKAATIEARATELTALHKAGVFEIPDDVPEPLKNILRKAIRPNPSERYQSAEEMLRDLQEAQNVLNLKPTSKLTGGSGGRPRIPTERKGPEGAKKELVQQINEQLSSEISDNCEIELTGDGVMGFFRKELAAKGARLERENLKIDADKISFEGAVFARGGSSDFTLTLGVDPSGKLQLTSHSIDAHGLLHKAAKGRIEGYVSDLPIYITAQIKSRIPADWDVEGFQLVDGKLSLKFKKSGTPAPETSPETGGVVTESKFVVGKTYISESGRKYKVTGVTVKPNGIKLIKYKFVGGGLEGKGNFSEGRWNEYIDAGRLKPEVTTVESTVDLGERTDPSKGSISTEASPDHPKDNQDSAVIDHARGFIGIFDGAGGHKGGGAASRIAMEQTNLTLAKLSLTASKVEVTDAFKAIVAGTFNGHQAHLSSHPEDSSMATTGSIIKIFEESGQKRLAILHAGDSRIYAVSKDGSVRQLTQDHSVVYQAVVAGEITAEQGVLLNKALDELKSVPAGSPEEREQNLEWFYFRNRNILDKGFARGGSPDYIEGSLSDDIQYVLATSDGVHDNLTRGEIEAICKAATSPKQLSDTLVRRAKAVSSLQRTNDNVRPKVDDITAAVLAV